MRLLRPACLLAITSLSVLTASSVLVAQSAPPLVPFRGLIDNVTKTLSGFATMGASDGSARGISGDGRFVIFSSNDQYLIQNDYNYLDDVFMRDRMTGTTTRVSIADDGSESNGMSQYAAISTNGRHVAFSSGATNLVAGDTNNHWDVFVRDLDANRTVRVSVSSLGAEGDADSYAPSISADGRYVAFLSAATTFSFNTVQYGPTQVYIHDRDTDENGIFDEPNGTMTRFISLGTDGSSPADQYCVRPRVSADGRYVMFESDASNLSEVGNANGQHHLYVRDRLTSHTELIDRAVTGGPSAWGVSWQSSDMSDDGRFITYTSVSPDIVWFDMNWQAQVFRYDAEADPPTSRTTIVSRRTDGVLANGSSYYTSVSGDGRFVAFMSGATNLVTPAPPTDYFALVVYDGVDGSFIRVDVLDGDIPFDGQYTFNPSLSADGTAIAFQSNAQNAIDGMFTWYSYHVFVATAFSAAPELAVFPQGGGGGSIDVNTTPVSGWNAVSYYTDWIVVMDGDGFGAGPRTIQYFVSPNMTGIVRNGLIRVGSKFITIRQEGDGDTTPPIITPIVTGDRTADGWYISDITVSWIVNDPESEIVNVGYGCAPATFTSDFIYANPTCEATSHGGTTTVSVPLKRDTTGPAIAIHVPQQTIYSPGSYIVPEFHCDEPYLYSGVASCAITEGSSPLDMTPGRHTFSVTARDNAFNTTTKTVEYLVGSDVCVTPAPLPVHLKGWWKFNGDLHDSVMNRDAIWNAGAGTFQPAVVQQGWQNFVSGNFLWAWEGSATIAGDGLTVATWINPLGQYGIYGTIVSNPLQYQIARYPDGTLRWAFNTTNGFNWVDTGVQIPQFVWSHIAVTYKDGVVQSYLNGRLVHSAPLDGSLITSGNPLENMTIGGQNGAMLTFNGTLDDLTIFDDALSPTEVESLALSGSGSLCTPFATNLTITVPATIVYGTTFQVSALLTDSGGRPLPNRALTITSDVTPGYVWNVQTTATGSVTVQFPINSSMTAGDHANAIAATFDGDDAFGASEAHASVTLVGGTPPLSWSAPAPITYGTALSGAQLNATSSFPGTFTYSPPAGTILGAGEQTLSVTFTPSDSDHWAARTMTTAIVVSKATPVMGAIGEITATYDGQPHGVSVSVTGANNEPLTPVMYTYNGSTTTPINAAAYAIEARYEGSANYNATSRTGTLTIVKGAPSLTWANPADIVYGTALSATQLNATANLAGSFAYSPASGAVLNAGSQTLSVTFTPADPANYNGATANVTLNVAKAPSTITWPAPGSIVYGTPLGGAQLNATANVAGTFAYSPSAGTVLAAGPRTLSVTFTPSDAANHLGSSASTSIAVNAAPLTIRTNDSSKVFGAPMPSFSATATGFVNGDSFASLSGSLAYSTSATAISPVGIYAVTPSGVASPNYAIAFANGTLNIVRASTATAVSALPNPDGFNQAVTLTAFVSIVAPGAGGPSGVVQFFDGATLLGSASLVGGTSSLTTNGFTAGSHSIAATYSGDTSFNASTGSATLAVKTSTQSSATVVTSSDSSSPIGQSVTLTATVTAPSGLSGSVQFYDGTTRIGTIALSGTTARLTTNALAAGGHAITARYLGNATIPPSTSAAFAQYIEAAGSHPRNSTTALVATPSPATLGSTVTLTATVTGSQNRAPSGTVLFMVNGSVMGQGTVTQTGSVTSAVSFAMAALAHGTHKVEVVYLGDSTFRASNTSITLVVN